MSVNRDLRRCFREPVPEIEKAAKLLDHAVSAHAEGQRSLADELIRQADIPAIREWTEFLWGKNSPYVKPKVKNVSKLPDSQLDPKREPSSDMKRQLHQRDGFHCRFCGIPVIRTEIRKRIKKCYPDALPWGDTNVEQHAGFQAMWLQYDHLVPYKRGGTTNLKNLVITCAPCNFGRIHYTLEEVGLINPFEHEPMPSDWDGLERFR